MPSKIRESPTNTVNATTGQTWDIEDVYRLEQALPARYQARASFMGSGTIINAGYRFAGRGSTEPPIVSQDRTSLLGKPLVLSSEMATVTTTGTKFLLYGDLRRYYIIDRIGPRSSSFNTSWARITGLRANVVFTVFGATAPSSSMSTPRAF